MWWSHPGRKKWSEAKSTGEPERASAAWRTWSLLHSIQLWCWICSQDSLATRCETAQNNTSYDRFFSDFCICHDFYLISKGGGVSCQPASMLGRLRKRGQKMVCSECPVAVCISASVPHVRRTPIWQLEFRLKSYPFKRRTISQCWMIQRRWLIRTIKSWNALPGSLLSYHKLNCDVWTQRKVSLGNKIKGCSCVHIV